MPARDLAEKAQEVADEVSAEADRPIEVTTDPERTREMSSTNFSRMAVTTEWTREDATEIRMIHDIIDGRILHNFADAYAIMNEVYDIVRVPEVDERTAVIRTDRFGFTVWKKGVNGAFIEDWSLLGIKQREHLLYRITAFLFEWEQRQAEAWVEAMFAKAKWEERFAEAFSEPAGRVTDEQRTQAGRLGARQERYFAIFLSGYSRKADSVVKSMERLALRLSQGVG